MTGDELEVNVVGSGDNGGEPETDDVCEDEFVDADKDGVHSYTEPLLEAHPDSDIAGS